MPSGSWYRLRISCASGFPGGGRRKAAFRPDREYILDLVQFVSEKLSIIFTERVGLLFLRERRGETCSKSCREGDSNTQLAVKPEPICAYAQTARPSRRTHIRLLNSAIESSIQTSHVIITSNIQCD